MLLLYMRIRDKYGLTGRPYLEIGRMISDADQITDIMKKAIKGQPIEAQIIVKDSNNAVLRLSKCGLLNEEFFKDQGNKAYE